MANVRKIQAEVTEITNYGDRVSKVLFRCREPFPRYKSGQFLHLALDDFDPRGGFWPDSRVFSIAESSDDRREITIVYSVKGRFSKRMREELGVGRSVWLKGPYGDFIIDKWLGDGARAVLIAGGTGLSPYVSFLSRPAPPAGTLLYYGLYSLEVDTFPEMIRRLIDEESIGLHLSLESIPNESVSLEGYQIRSGALDIDTIVRETSPEGRDIYFLSGPPAMIEAFQGRLAEFGVDTERIVTDDWS